MSIDFANVLTEMMARRASDLHITAGAHPMVRVRGALTALDDYPVPAPAQVAVVPDSSRTMVINSGKWKGSTGVMPGGGQTPLIPALG